MNFKSPKIAIYTGKGSSYSWIWLAETFDKFNLYNVNFIDKIENLQNFDILILPGGDTFLLAESIGKEKLQEIKTAIENGLIYFGICAGAYLPLNTSLTPLSWFNLVNAKISNISDDIIHLLNGDTKNDCIEIFDKNYTIPYGCSFVFHPIRDEVVVKIKEKEFKVPLFGGPVIKNCEDEIIAVYEKFTDKTLFLVSKNLAEEIVIGKIAVMKKNYGKGKLYLFAPHFEHPSYKNANIFFIEKIYENFGREENFCDVCYQNEKMKIAIERERKELEDKIAKELNELNKEIFCEENTNEIELKNIIAKKSNENYAEKEKSKTKELKRELSNARLLANSLDNISWKIGIKNWDPEKASYFLVGILKRIKNINSIDDECLKNAKNVVEILKEIKKNAKDGKDTIILADELIVLLGKIASSFFNCYFREKFVNYLN